MNGKKKLLITGANGQLGMEFRDLEKQYSQFHFLFVTKNELPINDFIAIEKFFKKNQIDACINCAAYTAVDKAETEKALAFQINGEAVGNLAKVCKINNIQFIHFSTDYVFDGNATIAYKETNNTNPVNLYGESKLRGEQLAIQNNEQSIIIRTSWVYSSHGKNFVKTMLRLMNEKESIGVVNDQYGSPTYAADLAEATLKIISEIKWQPGIYHYCNKGIINWYRFAEEIKKLTGSHCIVNPISTDGYPTPAARPQYSALDTNKIMETYNLLIPKWEISLEKCISLIQKLKLP